MCKFRSSREFSEMRSTPHRQPLPHVLLWCLYVVLLGLNDMRKSTNACELVAGVSLVTCLSLAACDRDICEFSGRFRADIVCGECCTYETDRWD